MQVGHALFIAFELVGFAVEREAAVANAVGAAAGRRAKIGGMVEIAFEIGEPEHQRRLMAIQPQVLDHAAPGEDMGGKATTGEHDTMNRLTRWQVSEDFRVRMLVHRLAPTTAPRVLADAQRSLYTLELLHVVSLNRLERRAFR